MSNENEKLKAAMTAEELLRPRVIIENLWPGCSRKVGDILIKDKYWYWVVGDTGWTNKVDPREVEPYPYLMRPLQWWEEREYKDLPKYVRWHFGGVFEVSNWRSSPNTAQISGAYIDGREAAMIIDNLLPATEAEYLDYTKQII